MNAMVIKKGEEKKVERISFIFFVGESTEMMMRYDDEPTKTLKTY